MERSLTERPFRPCCPAEVAATRSDYKGAVWVVCQCLVGDGALHCNGVILRLHSCQVSLFKESHYYYIKGTCGSHLKLIGLVIESLMQKQGKSRQAPCTSLGRCVAQPSDRARYCGEVRFIKCVLRGIAAPECTARVWRRLVQRGMMTSLQAHQPLAHPFQHVPCKAHVSAVQPISYVTEEVNGCFTPTT